MNDKKIAFITCVNNEKQYTEALHYIQLLIVPEGYETDVIAVREAPSMTAGYNAAMKSSDAKYKVYLHQDVFIINKNFIRDMISFFEADKTLGMLGCVGCDYLPLHAKAVEVWNTGLVYHNCTPSKMVRKQSDDGTPSYVEALDGLLLATQYDVEWREDLFDGWDFYDISQCFEMQRAGYKVAAAYQSEPWCYHDNTYSKLGNYQKYCERFAKEYQDIKPFHGQNDSSRIEEFEVLKEQSRNEMRRLVDVGAKIELRDIFDKTENKGYLHLRDFEILANIDRLEAQAGITSFWRLGDTFEVLADKIASVKRALKRIEYFADVDGSAMKYLVENYSIWAIDVIYCIYEVDKAQVWDEIVKKL